MCVPLLIVLIQAGPTLGLGGVIDRYFIDAQIDPISGIVQVTAVMDLAVPESGLASFEFFLNEGLEVTDVRSDAPILGVTRHDERLGEFRFAPTGVPIEVAFGGELEPGRSLAVSVTYEGIIVTDPWGTNRVTADWVELGMYTAWFPLKPDEKAFTSNVTVALDSAYAVAGSGRVSRGRPTDGKRQWTLEQTRPSDDIVVVAGPELRRREVATGNAQMVLYESRFSPATIEQIVSDVSDIVGSGGKWFGEPEPIPLTVILADRDRGGGYTRPGLVVVTYDGGPETYSRFAKGLAHEISHFWWSRAPATSWQDWLNESFAEFSALMWVRAHMGEEAFAGYVHSYTLQSADLPPIRDLARDHEEAYAVLYRKGPMVLFRLEEEMGRDRFISFLRATYTNEVGSTAQLLELLERHASPEARRVLEEGLVGSAFKP
jgi:hypothetical protein